MAIKIIDGFKGERVEEVSNIPKERRDRRAAINYGTRKKWGDGVGRRGRKNSTIRESIVRRRIIGIGEGGGRVIGWEHARK